MQSMFATSSTQSGTFAHEVPGRQLSRSSENPRCLSECLDRVDIISSSTWCTKGGYRCFGSKFIYAAYCLHDHTLPSIRRPKVHITAELNDEITRSVEELDAKEQDLSQLEKERDVHRWASFTNVQLWSPSFRLVHHRSASFRPAVHHRSASINLFHHRSVSIKLVRHRSTSLTFIQPRLTSFNLMHYHSASFNLMHHRSASFNLIQPHDSALFNLVQPRASSFSLVQPRASSW